MAPEPTNPAEELLQKRTDILNRVRTDIAIAWWDAAANFILAFGEDAEGHITRADGWGITKDEAEHLLYLVGELRKPKNRAASG